MPARPELPGRTKEVARLRDAWAAAVVGEPRLLLLTGEAGIGKTRLATEVVALAETTGGLVMQARCYTAERSLFLQPFVDALAGPVATMRADRLRELPGARTAAFAGLLPGVDDLFDPPPPERTSPELGDHAAAGALIRRAITLADRHGMPTIERDARAYLAALPLP